MPAGEHRRDHSAGRLGVGDRDERSERRQCDDRDEREPLLHSSSFWDESASTTRIGSSSARCATSAASRPEGASKTKKQISSSGTWIERSKRTRTPPCVSS